MALPVGGWARAVAVAALPAACAAWSPSPLCYQAGLWGTATCLAAETGVLARDAAGFALAGVLPASWCGAAAENLRAFRRVVPAEKAAENLQAKLAALWESSKPWETLVVSSLDGVIEQQRAAFVGAFPAHAALLPDAASLVAAAVWVLIALVLTAFGVASLARTRQLPEVYFFPDKSGRHVARICAQVASARRRVWVAMFTLTNDLLTKEILAAHTRGVDVRVILDDDQCLVPGADAKMLADMGVRIVTDRSAARMHHKFALLDSAVLTGSFNWTRAASHSNSENLCVLRDTATVKAFAGEFDRMWVEFAGRSSRGVAKVPAAGVRRQRDKTPPYCK